MTRYLLAAEADKIQDLLFRSAKLREVAGGSQLLSRFCDEVPALLDPRLRNRQKKDVVISKGGSFRILFDSETDAETFGEQLAEVYRRAVGGSLTVARPVEVESPVDEHFQQASKEAHENLRRAKRWRKDVWQGQEHLPYTAFCASCGIGLAVTHKSLPGGEEAQYLCKSCLNKSAERRSRKNSHLPAQKQMGEFLAKFYKLVAEQRGLTLNKIHWPGEEENPQTGEVDPLEDVAEYDSRHYVAYIVADGNNMGQVFSECATPKQMQKLSQGLTKAVRKALAEPTGKIMKHNPLDDRIDFIPVYPLILGGDDIFVLLPAPWALDFARCFAQAYEREMKNLVQEIELQVSDDPTIAVAVVICKSKHPYSLAYEAGERRLKQAKQMGKQLVLDGKQVASTVTFEVVLGGRLVESREHKKIRPTLRPYWSSDGDDVSTEWGVSINHLIDQRLALKDVPRKRLAELRNLYDLSNLPTRTDDMQSWQAHLERLLKRIGRNEKHRDAVKTALATLGEDESPHWRNIDRRTENWYGHGFPDLLETWDFALNLEKRRQDYEER